ILLLCMTVGLFAVSCSDGDTGPQGEPGEAGETGPPGTVDTDKIVQDVLDKLDEDDNKSEDEKAEDCTIPAGPSNPVGPSRTPFSGTSTDDVICGTDNADWIQGDGGDDTIFGRKGNDLLNGQAGEDMLHGGEGDDTLRAGDGNDVFDGGAGSDTVDYSLDVTAPDSGDPHNLTINLTVGEVKDDSHGDEDTFISIENIIGGAGDDTITGNDEDNTLTGGAGDDTIDGGAGDDTIDGGAGDAIMQVLRGGIGNDTLVVTAAGTTTLNEAGGTQAASDIANESDDDLTSSGFENLTGGLGADTLNGNTGDNVLDGAMGANTLRGDPAGNERGKDTFVVWTRGGVGQTDTIQDFEFPTGSGTPKDRIVVRRAPGIVGKSTAQVTDTEGQIQINTGRFTQTILVQTNGTDALPEPQLRALTGQKPTGDEPGTGSAFLSLPK
ncbi:MAG: calcium-binding protein, partial [Candidatus Dadabacteria bacterium]|nr:calcium-binding protein [Candidatus Dadabacteria bacterium]